MHLTFVACGRQLIAFHVWTNLPHPPPNYLKEVWEIMLGTQSNYYPSNSHSAGTVCTTRASLTQQKNTLSNLVVANVGVWSTVVWFTSSAMQLCWSITSSALRLHLSSSPVWIRELDALCTLGLHVAACLVWTAWPEWPDWGADYGDWQHIYPATHHKLVHVPCAEAQDHLPKNWAWVACSRLAAHGQVAGFTPSTPVWGTCPSCLGNHLYRYPARHAGVQASGTERSPAGGVCHRSNSWTWRRLWLPPRGIAIARVSFSGRGRCWVPMPVASVNLYVYCSSNKS